MQMPTYTPWTLWQEQEQERAALRRGATYVGVSLILMQVMSIVIGLTMSVPMMYAVALEQTNFLRGFFVESLINIVCYLGMLLLPPLLLARAFRRPCPVLRERRLGAPTLVLGTTGGLALCVLANFLVSRILMFFTSMGITPTEGAEDVVTSDWQVLALNLFVTALLPALVEELVFRGYFLEALRPFGDRRALWMSALLFGLIHGNMAQIPFAFILGLVFAYAAMQSGSLLLPMLIHFCNNAMAVVLAFVEQYVSAEQYNALVLVVFGVLALVGGVSLTVLLALRHPLIRRVDNDRSAMPAGERRRAMAAPAMIIAIVLMLGITLLGVVAAQ